MYLECGWYVNINGAEQSGFRREEFIERRGEERRGERSIGETL
jgi:hypothetical protein